MAVDTPATIAIIGAGPIGLEAALYARFLGYDVRIYERDAVARSLRDDEPAAQHVWRASTSPLGIAALSAQQAQWQPAEPDALLSATELAERYFLPLAQSDLLVDHLLIGSEVIGLEPRSPAGPNRRGGRSHRLSPARSLAAGRTDRISRRRYRRLGRGNGG